MLKKFEATLPKVKGKKVIDIIGEWYTEEYYKKYPDDPDTITIVLENGEKLLVGARGWETEGLNVE